MFALHLAWILLCILLGFLLKQNIIYPKGYKMQIYETNKKIRNKRKEESDIKKKRKQRKEKTYTQNFKNELLSIMPKHFSKPILSYSVK